MLHSSLIPYQMPRISSMRTKIKLPAAATYGGSISGVETPRDLIEAPPRVETDGAHTTEESWDTLKIDESLFDGVLKHVNGQLKNHTNSSGGGLSKRRLSPQPSSSGTSNCSKHIAIDVQSDATTQKRSEVEEDGDRLSLSPSSLRQEEPISVSQSSASSPSSLTVESVKLYCSFEPCLLSKGSGLKNNKRRKEVNRPSSSSCSIYQTPPLYIAEWTTVSASDKSQDCPSRHTDISRNKEKERDYKEEEEGQDEKGSLTVFAAESGSTGVTTLGDVLALAAPPKKCLHIRALEKNSSTQACSSRWVATLTFVVTLYDGKRAIVGHHGYLVEKRKKDSASFKGSFIDPWSNSSPYAMALVPAGRIPLDGGEALARAKEKRSDDDAMRAIIVAHLKARELKLSQMRAESQAPSAVTSSRDASPCPRATAPSAGARRKKSKVSTNRGLISSGNPTTAATLGEDCPHPPAAVSSTSAARAMVASLPHDEVFAYVRRHGSRAFNEITHSARQAARTDTTQ